MTAKAIPLFILLAVISHPVIGLEDERSSFIRLRALYSQAGQWRLSAKTDWLFPDLFLGPVVTFSHFDIEDVEEGGILDSGRVLGSDHATLIGFEACYLQEGTGQHRRRWEAAT